MASVFSGGAGLKKLFQSTIDRYVFLTALVVKLICAGLFGSHYLRDMFIPFVQYFVSSGFSNPWNEFLQRGVTDAFPYSTTMLFALAAPQVVLKTLFGGFENVPAFLTLLSMRLPLLLADAAIFAVLCRWAGSAKRLVLWLYWCSPIVFFITYIYGHFDVLPTALLIASIYFAIGQRSAVSGLFMGAAILAKFHVAAATPLVVFYLWKNLPSNRRTIGPLLFAFSCTAAVALLGGPVFSSAGYQALVLGAKESSWVMQAAFPMANDMRLLICPAVLAGLLLHFLSYHRVTRDVLIMYTGLLYTALIVLVTPQPGWALWCVPFLYYFLIRHDAARYVPFWVYTFAYLVYFSYFSKGTALTPVEGMDTARMLVFTVMQTSLALVALWVYRIGIRSYAQYKTYRPHVVIGIAGDSAAGKHTLADTLTSVTGEGQTVRLHGDDYHRWPREHEAWQSVTHLDPRSNYFQEPVKHLKDLKNGQSVTVAHYDHASGSFSAPEALSSNRFITFEGLHPFVFQGMRDIFDIKIFLDTDENLRRSWKLKRDTEKRGHAKEKVLAEIDRREEDARKYVRPQSAFADWTIQYGMPNGSDNLTVRHEVSSDVVEIEGIMDALSQESGWKGTWYMAPDLRRQVIEMEGPLSAEAVERAAHRVFPDLLELIKSKPAWKSGLDGLSQLLFIAVLNTALKK